MQCDEGRPACHRCVSTGRVCDGYGIWGGGGNAYSSMERRQTPAKFPQKMPMDVHARQCLLWSKSPVVIPGMGPQEQTALDYFRTRMVYKLPGVFASEFWASTVFQASFAEPAVFHAVIALGAIHRNEWNMAANLENGRRVQSNESLALLHYNKAIRCLLGFGKSRDKQSLRPVLVACVVFICLELLRCRYRTAQAHLQSGLKLLSDMQNHPRRTGRAEGKCNDGEDSFVAPPQRASVDDQLIEALARLHIHSALFCPGPGYLQDTVPGYRSSAVHAMPRIFQTVGAARQHLDQLIDGVSFLSAQIRSNEMRCPIPEDVVRQKELLQASLARWLCTYTTSLPSLASSGNTKTSLSLLLLRLYHTMASIMASTCLRLTDETVFDLRTQGFSNMLAQAVELFRQWTQLTSAPPGNNRQQTPNLSFTLDMGHVPPLYYVALKCREPRLRRRAIELLMSMPHKEGVWDGEVAAYVARQVMEMEEGGESYDNGYAEVEPASVLSVVPE
ncbi:7320f4d4-7f59-4fb8-9880-eadbd3543a1c [Thermothielavioides terrestris]|uniref:7320f4d4-7f59-4fb8-9880-eadbd3543a1c n=1 Tax=Thermothielavioides terrestris TaxID=2587410 RepID=A0A3S5CVR1_9PEZI|nr:7320f4d4-7f59-4fb8-9880-eadbd3543a1c [Thermothielavioides terrestris]